MEFAEKKYRWWQDKSAIPKMHIFHLRNAIEWCRQNKEFLHSHKYWYDKLHVELQRRQPKKKKKVYIKSITEMLQKNKR